MKRRLGISISLLLATAAIFLAWRWIQGQERRDSAKAVETLCQALQSGDQGLLLQVVAMPQMLAHRTFAEQSEFLTKALRDEVSPEGLAVLRRRAAFGPLKELFPAEAEKWAQGAGVNPDDCVAFKLERNRLRAEVVLVKPSTLDSQPSAREAPFRIVRLNNVKQLADASLLTTAH